MRKKLSLFSLISAGFLCAQSPVITSWMMNTTGDLGNYSYYATMPSSGLTSVNMTDSSDVLRVCYTPMHVFVQSDGLANYSMGPFVSNPNQPAAKNYVFKLPINPTPETTTHQYTIGTIGVTVNGLKIYGPSDARSYQSSSGTNVSNGDGNWWADAWLSEGSTMDANGNGHPDQNGNYHHHANPSQLYADPSTTHSPIIGFATDGYPIYGPFGYTDSMDASSAIVRIQSSYQLRNITTRTTLPGGGTSSPAGPAVSTSFPLGTYLQDYEYVAGLGDLDEYNGRYCVTPEYPTGTYAYFMSTDANGDPKYPYFLTGTFYGVVSSNDVMNFGSSMMPSTNLTCYTGATAGTSGSAIEVSGVSAFPNPATENMNLMLSGGSSFNVNLIDVVGKNVKSWNLLPGSNNISLTEIPAGVYFLNIMDNTGETSVVRIVKQ